MNTGEAEDVQTILSYFLDPDGDVEDLTAMSAARCLAERAYKRLGAGLAPDDVRAMFRELLEAVDAFELDGRPIEDVPVGELL